MIATHIEAFPSGLSDDQVAFFDREYLSSFGRILTDEELFSLRFAYERIWEAQPAPPQKKDSQIPGHLSLTMEAFSHESPFTLLIGNDYILKMASHVLHASPEDLVYVGGYLHWQRLQNDWNYEDWFWDGWHVDAKPSLDPLTHVNVWVYLDDCTRNEGATQALVGSCEKQRENIKAGKTATEVHEENSVHKGIREMLDAVGTDPDKGTWAEAPAGGGFMWSSFLWHRITPNHSGVRRRLLTLEYDVRQNGAERSTNGSRASGTLLKERSSVEQRRQMAEMLPVDKRYLIDINE